MTVPQGQIDRELGHLFRRHAGEMVAVLSRIFGPAHLDLVEDVVQEAFLTALRRWPYDGVPESPRAWITQVAKNRALDALRRSRRWRDRASEVERQIVEAMARTGEPAEFEREIRDDQLQLTFACCHPEINRDAQVALTLKTVGGFSTGEIARAFLTQESTIAQRLVRAKRRLRAGGIALEMPGPVDLAERRDSVLESIYLIFNEGYHSFDGVELIRADLCREAIRLAELVAEHPVTRAPRVNALLALFHFQAARLPARSGPGGEVLLLEEQDRTRWDSKHIYSGLAHLRESAQGMEESEYHLQAEIASCHTLAQSHAATDWRRILECYDRLRRRHPSPIVELNRAVAVAEVEGCAAGLRALEGLERHSSLDRYYPFFVTRGELLRRLGRTAEARADFELARELVASEPIGRFLQRKIEQAGLA